MMTVCGRQTGLLQAQVDWLSGVIKNLAPKHPFHYAGRKKMLRGNIRSRKWNYFPGTTSYSFIPISKESL